MNTPCPCGCGRRLPLSDIQIRDITCYSRWRNELDIADAYGCTISTVRHCRQVWRSDGSLALGAPTGPSPLALRRVPRPWRPVT